MGTIVVGYVPKPEGWAASRLAGVESKLRGSKLVVVNSRREVALDSDAQLDQVRVELRAAGVQCEVRQVVGMDAGEDLLEVAAAAEAVEMQRRLTNMPQGTSTRPASSRASVKVAAFGRDPAPATGSTRRTSD